MTDEAIKSSKRVLEPIDRVSEVLFGLIVALTFTGSLSVAEVGRSEVRTMLIGALGCNLVRAVREATDPNEAHRLIADALPPVVASVLKPAELEAVHIRQRDGPTMKPHRPRKEPRTQGFQATRLT